MISGLQANTPGFLASLSNLENRMSRVTQELSSGMRVNQASDDPTAVSSIIAYQSHLDAIKQVQTNLSNAQAEAQTADGALQQAATLMDQLVSLGTQGATGTTDATTRATLVQKVQAIQQQLVSLANTAVNGRYIFGADAVSTVPYQYTGTGTNGVNAGVASPGPTNTQILRDADGNSINPRMTAQQIFDAPGASVFQAAYDLANALSSNTGVSAAIDEVKNGLAQISSASTSYANVESWLSQGLSAATAHTNSITAALSSIRDADIPSAATELSMDQNAMQAAIAADGSLNQKSLFNYLG